MMLNSKLVSELYDLPLDEIFRLFTHKKQYLKHTSKAIQDFFGIIYNLHHSIIWKKYKKYKPEVVPPNVVELVKLMMRPKKVFEITNLLYFLLPKITKHSINLILDVGCGQGYISYILAGAKSNLRIHGIDGKKSNITAFTKRIKEVSAQHKHRICSPPEDYRSRFRLESMFVNKEKIDDIGKTFIKPDNPMLITLHGCGDLSSTLIAMFSSLAQIKQLFLISCCFNLLTEKVSEIAKATFSYKLYSDHVKNDLTTQILACGSKELTTGGYPMSEYMRKAHPEFFLGRIIRYAAAASLSFLFEEDKRSFALSKMIYRAALEKYMQDNCPELCGNFETGRVDTAYMKSFADYVKHFAVAEPLLEKAVEKSDPQEFYKVNIEPYEKLFTVYVGMRGVIAQLVELVIALDRQCYLWEKGYKSKLYYVYKGEKSHHNIAIFAKR